MRPLRLLPFGAALGARIRRRRLGQHRRRRPLGLPELKARKERGSAVVVPSVQEGGELGWNLDFDEGGGSIFHCGVIERTCKAITQGARLWPASMSLVASSTRR